MADCRRRWREVELYLVSGAERADEIELVRRAARGGVSICQLRAKGCSEAVLYPRAERLSALCAELDLPLIINDQPKLARRLDAAGVHLGQSDGPLAAARDVLGEGKLIGRSTHSEREAEAAAREGADYIAVGCVFPTRSKPDARPLEAGVLERIAFSCPVPVFAIGGIGPVQAGQLASRGIRRAAVISAIWDSPHPEQAAAALTRELELRTNDS